MERVVHVNLLHLVKVHMCLAVILVQKIFNAILPKVAVVVARNTLIVNVEVIHVLLLYSLLPIACASDKIASIFRTVSRQNYFWNCYITKRCNQGNLAACPGT
jgi:hypothetical protein